MLGRLRVRLIVLGSLAAFLGVSVACASSTSPSNLAVDTIVPTAVATTAPVGIPVAPTPTRVDIPTSVPTPSSVDSQAVGRDGPNRDAAAPPDATSTAEPTPAAEPTATSVSAETPVETAADESQPPTPEPSATPVTTAVVTTSGPDPDRDADSGSPEGTAPTEAPVPDTTARVVVDSDYQPLGQAGTVILYLPVARIELIGFHEAGHPGSQAINAAGTGVPMLTMDSRSRGTAPRSAADIVVPPNEPVVAPITGTVVASNSYVLYCEYDDRLVYIEPDGLPGWQVRVFHLEGEGPVPGSRVIGGVTPIGAGARILPFESQVDEYTAEPSWPHVHVEVVDTTVPDTRPPGPGCD